MVDLLTNIRRERKVSQLKRSRFAIRGEVKNG